jgi:GTP-binding protein HflX
VWNKVDLLEGEDRAAVENEADRRNDVITLSALTGEGEDRLAARVAELLREGAAVHHLRLSAREGGKLAWLHSRGEVLDSRNEGDEMFVVVRLSPENWQRWQGL